MENHFNLSDEKFLEEFTLCKFDPTNFTHEAHLRLAYLNIARYGSGKAEQEVQKQIKNFVTHLGAFDKYNTTLTIAAVKVVNHFKVKSNSKNFQELINEFPELKNNFLELLQHHYSFDIFNSTEAKKRYLEPDLLEF